MVGYINSQKHGEYKEYNRDEKLMIEGSFNQNNKRGEWRFYDEAGNLLKTEDYSNNGKNNE